MRIGRVENAGEIITVRGPLTELTVERRRRFVDSKWQGGQGGRVRWRRWPTRAIVRGFIHLMRILAALMIISAVTLGVVSAQAQDWAKDRLEKSPRHLEWVKVKTGDREVNCFIAYPEVKEKAAAVQGTLRA